MIPDPVAARDALHQAVNQVLARLTSRQQLSRLETEHVDLKEEAGRRDRTGALLPGSAANPDAANQLAGEVRCFANTPGGGAIILGIEDKTLSPLGTQLEIEWLRQRLDDLTGIAPAIEERDIRGFRLLVLLISESPEPVEDPDQRLRWRVGDRCTTVDRAEWWSHRADRIGVDFMAAPTERRPTDITSRTRAAARDYLRQGGDTDAADADDTQLLTRIGVLRPSGTLSQAGALVLCPSPRSLVELSRLDVAGGDVTLRYTHQPGASLLEALAEIESRIDAINAVRPQSRGFVESGQRLLPARAVREAILNGLTHRDWFQGEPTTVRWIEVDATLEVTSPGGFTGGVTAVNALTTRHSRYPALADLFRALRLVDRQGVGVPRMYQTMLAEGHRAPLLEELPGPRVRTTWPDGRSSPSSHRCSPRPSRFPGVETFASPFSSTRCFVFPSSPSNKQPTCCSRAATQQGSRWPPSTTAASTADHCSCASPEAGDWAPRSRVLLLPVATATCLRPENSCGTGSADQPPSDASPRSGFASTLKSPQATSRTSPGWRSRTSPRSCPTWQPQERWSPEARAKVAQHTSCRQARETARERRVHPRL